ncbi:prepilin peptidase [Rhodococcus qingshengii]|jgi:leader peptidase (prepilin peptidase)/N-methyltransferase|uniref:Prepilin type IV endopeptidase peptidase domain-containing protein n=1 Tax=Rhodococcus qingshengii TaxID=334542 RepID=A0A2A5J057_RHOSG|nr:prepilin peptidase [Rhodococcus qingshengii]PCK22619.1 hypothetical protein CHR55_31890 [Rhodococcus qingshengii]
MSVWTVALACAAAAGVLACGVPTLVRLLPAPANAGESDVGAAGGSASVSYAAIAAERWFLPAGVVVSMVGAGLLGAAIGADPLLVVLVPLVPLGYALAVIDARTRLLPRRLVVPATLGVLAALVVEWAATGDLEVLVRAVAGLVMARMGFWVLWFLGAGLGFGDVRLAALVGLVTARLDWQAFVVGIYGALVLALLFVLVRWVVTRRPLRGDEVSLGPFLVLGAWVGLLVGAGS